MGCLATPFTIAEINFFQLNVNTEHPGRFWIWVCANWFKLKYWQELRTVEGHKVGPKQICLGLISLLLLRRNHFSVLYCWRLNSLPPLLFPIWLLLFILKWLIFFIFFSLLILSEVVELHPHVLQSEWALPFKNKGNLKTGIGPNDLFTGALLKLIGKKIALLFLRRSCLLGHLSGFFQAGALANSFSQGQYRIYSNETRFLFFLPHPYWHGWKKSHLPYNCVQGNFTKYTVYH